MSSTSDELRIHRALSARLFSEEGHPGIKLLFGFNLVAKLKKCKNGPNGLIEIADSRLLQVIAFHAIELATNASFNFNTHLVLTSHNHTMSGLIQQAPSSAKVAG